jgi:ubiquitin-activating enzyme E1
MFFFFGFRYVLGHDAMKRMGACNVLIAGLKGLGAEIGNFLVIFRRGLWKVEPGRIII